MRKYFDREEGGDEKLTKRDFLIGTIIAAVLLTAFSLGSSGASLIATFVPGLIFSWGLFAYLYFYKIDLPSLHSFLPVYLISIAWQFIHFTEEFVTNFKVLFPEVYGGQPYTNDTFVAFNMTAYFVFVLAAVLFYFKGLRFLFLPILFFTVYGALGNAISHTWWTIYFGEYFPGFYTALLYWVLAPILLRIILKSKKRTAIFISTFAVVLVLMLTLFMS